MEDEASANIKDLILAPHVNRIDQCASVKDMVDPTITVIRELAKEIQTDHQLYISTLYNPKGESKELVDDLGCIVKMLQQAITFKKEKSAQLITNIKTDRQKLIATVGYLGEDSSSKGYILNM